MHRVRDLGGVLFIDVRDRHGITQVVVDSRPGAVGRQEAALGVRDRRAGHGPARARPRRSTPKLPTGEVEVAAREIRLLNEAKTPPFPIADDSPVSEDMRLRYRYLDLRRPRLQHNLGLRHRVTMAIRKYFDAQGFCEIETPILTKSTPEGARDYLVPSRVHPGEFYALPQSPQIFKQILMIAGMDRYFQIVKCFRDEDLRADRQPEFTQVDVEISFAQPDLVFAIIEPLIQVIFREIGVDVPAPFRRMPYAEAMAKYGSDKPDLRFGMEIVDVSTGVRRGRVQRLPRHRRQGRRGARARRCPARRGTRARSSTRSSSRRSSSARSASCGRARSTARMNTNVKAAGEATLLQSMELAGLRRPGPAPARRRRRPTPTSKLLGALRLSLAKKENLIPPDTLRVPLGRRLPAVRVGSRRRSGGWPCTTRSPRRSTSDSRCSRPIRATCARKAYDLVLNGSEIGGGSIRIHDSAVQSRIFQLLNISDEDAKLRFGFFVDALEYGTPPHGGIALGLDRIVAILADESSIREVIAFPKTAAGGRPDVGRAVAGRRQAAARPAAEDDRHGEADGPVRRGARVAAAGPRRGVDRTWAVG